MGVALHDGAVHERAGVALVAVADHILLALGLAADAVPLSARGKARAAAAAGADYIGSGAAFATSTKETAAPIGPEGLRAVVEAVSIPVVAIGGIKEENISKLKGTGIAGCAIVSAIFSKPDIKADIYSFGMVVRDMARLTGDAYLRRIAAACTRRNASERPADMSAVMSLPRTDNRQRIVVALLALVVAALTAYVAVTLYNRSTASDDARQDNAPIEIAPDSNRALDYTLWPERGEK